MDVLLFYSLKSKKSTDVLAFVQQHGIAVTPICVDSREIRNRLKTSSSIKIKGVPTILVVQNSEGEVYEGPQVMQWFDQLIRQKINSQPNFMDDEFDELTDYTQVPSSMGNFTNAPTSMPSVTTGANAKEKQMMNVKDIARQMEAERKASLGYDEEMLPKY